MFVALFALVAADVLANRSKKRKPTIRRSAEIMEMMTGRKLVKLAADTKRAYDEAIKKTLTQPEYKHLSKQASQKKMPEKPKSKAEPSSAKESRGQTLGKQADDKIKKMKTNHFLKYRLISE